MRLARLLFVSALLLGIAVVTMAPRGCPGCDDPTDVTNISEKFVNEFFDVDIAQITRENINGTVVGSGSFVPSESSELFDAGTGRIEFRGTYDPVAGTFAGKASYEFEGTFSDGLGGTFGTEGKGNVDFIGSLTESPRTGTAFTAEVDGRYGGVR